jgi:flagellar protein FlaG
MSSNFPIGSLSSSKASIPFSDDASSKLTRNKPPLSDLGSYDFNAIQTFNDLKTAELRGAPVSVGDEQLIKTIERANKALQGVMTSFEFSIHEKTHEIMVKVIDKDTGDVIREIPPEKTLDMVAKMWELAGIIVDKKV